MKHLKKIVALILVALMSLSFAGCHKKGEIAVTVGEVDFTVGYYLCALVNAELEGRDKVNASLTEVEQSSETIDYHSKKIEDKEFTKWVEDTALEYLKEIAAYKTLCAEKKAELDEEEVKNIESAAEDYWTGYGYSIYYEPNNVAKETYIQYMKDTCYSELYFEKLYGAEGEKAIDENEVITKLYENFEIANVLETAYSEDMTDAQKAAKKTEFEGYMNEIKKGTSSFADIYKKVNNISEEDAAAIENEEGPKDKYASLLGAEGTSRESSRFDTVKAMKTGEIKIVEMDNDAGLALIVKQDIKNDDYYKTALDMEARHLIADEEFEKTMKEYIGGLKPQTNKKILKEFKAKDIVIPTTTY